MAAIPESYTKLADLCREISTLGQINGILVWDQHVMMSSGSADARGKQMAALSAIMHEKQTSNEMKQAIEAAKVDAHRLAIYEKAVVRDAERKYRHKAGVKKELEKEIAQHEVTAVEEWIDARKNNDFPKFAPNLVKSIDLAKQYAKATRPEMDYYDALIDMHERGMTEKRLTEIFAQIADPLKKLTSDIVAAQDSIPEIHSALKGGEEWDVEQQSALCKEVAKVLGFDTNMGRIDVSAHPFTIDAGPTDTRITTRYSTNIPFEGIMGTIHEVGHAMYEQGLNKEFVGLPVCSALSMGTHESQSLFWERMISQREEFWEYILPLIHEKLPHTKSATAQDFYLAVNQVSRSLIRVEADEVTYPFHIVLRFEIEKGLIDGSIRVEDLPAVWQEKFKKYIGIDVPNNSKGCLQDVHWADGSFGYFPTYTLGAMMAAQLFYYLENTAMPDIKDKIRTGKFSDIKEWLNKNLHEKGSLYTSLDELLKSITGEPLNPKYFVSYLETKYRKIYKL